MSKNAAHNDGLFINLGSSLIAGALLALPFLMLALFYVFKRPISRLLNLEERSMHWPAWSPLLLPLKWLAALGFAYGTVQATCLFWDAPAFPEKAFLAGLLYVCMMLACAGVFNLIHWLQQYCLTPSTQKKIAGLQAERFVRKLIEASRHHFHTSQTIHGALFVFNKDTADEFSVEVDHLLITQRNIFIIETKYKSGTIIAEPNARQWKVTSARATRPMQNALKQAKNAAQVLKREFHLPTLPIPLVAIKGHDVHILGGPANVVRAEDLFSVIEAFECRHPRPLFDPMHVAAGISQRIDTGQAALERHIARAEVAKRRAEQANIVDAASIQ